MNQYLVRFNVLSNKRVRLIILITVLILLSVQVSAQELPPLTHNLTPMEKIESAPALQLENMDEEVIDILDLKGKVVVVNFWATWCPPCRREMGSLERLYQLTKDKNVEVLAVNIGEDMDTVFSFFGTIEPSPNFQILFDSDAALMGSWNVKGLPTTYILDAKGNIIYRAIGGREFDHPEILQKIDEL